MSRASDPKSGGKEPAPLYLTFDENALLGALFGEHDRNLARLEQKLGVSISSRGNRLAVSGRASDCARAKKILTELYDLLKSGVPVGAQEVDAALRMSSSADTLSGVTRLLSEDTMISTPKRHLLPPPPTQAAYVPPPYPPPPASRAARRHAAPPVVGGDWQQAVPGLPW